MRGFLVRSRALWFIGAASLIASCGLFEPHTVRDCWNPDCSPRDAGTAGAAADAAVGDGSAGTSGVTAGEGGTGGVNDGGAGTGGGADGSSSACVGCTPDEVCDETSRECVQCLNDDDCSGATPACSNNTCVGCTDSGKHCAGDTPLCDVPSKTCRQCLDNTDCEDPAASSCNAGSCEPCATNTHCAHLDDFGICDQSGGSGKCVECTPSNSTACGSSPGGKAYVCDSQERTCTTREHGSAPPCGPCVADAECRTGMACMFTKFGTANTGTFCLWKEDAASPGGPNGDCATVRQYLTPESSWESVDGQNLTVCKLGRTTCQAQNDFFTKTCSGDTTTGHAECGASGIDDALCAPFGASQHFCTIPCGAALDCKNIRAGDELECTNQSLGGANVDACVFQ